jgi:hypothetical protein
LAGGSLLSPLVLDRTSGKFITKGNMCLCSCQNIEILITPQNPLPQSLRDDYSARTQMSGTKFLIWFENKHPNHFFELL